MTTQNPAYSRTARLIGEENVEALRRKKVAVFGLGGVGGSAFQALVRSGVGTLLVVDADTFEESNLNRQALSGRANLGKRKVDAAVSFAQDIDPSTKVLPYPLFYLPETAKEIPLDQVDYVLDCIDTISAKEVLILECKKRGIPILSSMGVGNRLDPSKLRIGDLYETSGDPVARILRANLRKKGVTSLKVCFSTEPARKVPLSEAGHGRHSPASSPFVPPAAGLLMASACVQDLIQEDPR